MLHHYRLSAAEIPALATDQRGLRFRPGIQAALRAGEPDAAYPGPGLRFAFARCVGGKTARIEALPVETKAAIQKAPASEPKGPAVDDVIAHMFAGFAAAGRTGAARIQTDALHLRTPLSVVIAASSRFSEALLPDMSHLM